MPTASVIASGEVWDGILHNVRWDDAALTYSFPTNASFYATTYSNFEEPDAGFEPLNDAQKAAASRLLEEVATFTNLSFQLLTETATTHATMRFAMTTNTPTATAVGYYPADTDEAGDTWYQNGVGATIGSYDNPQIGNFAYNEGFMHEIGHSLGLRHGHNDDNNPFGGLPRGKDSNEFSVMTYRDYIGDELGSDELRPCGRIDSGIGFGIPLGALP